MHDARRTRILLLTHSNSGSLDEVGLQILPYGLRHMKLRIRMYVKFKSDAQGLTDVPMTAKKQQENIIEHSLCRES